MNDQTDWGDFRLLVQEGMGRKGLSLRELCRKADIDASFMSKVLAGKRNPPFAGGVLASLARILDIEPARLFLSVGLIPQGWQRVRKDKQLFAAVNNLIAGLPVEAATQPADRTKNLKLVLPDELL